ncbi:MAG: redox-sensing transcriptional repressor Rex [Oscillospiraceae bacterium]|nr:redox-sensing transcriptional repressor Rex [Oscillospiraceae bacterium]MBO5917481.1 redox-sensing transcriptional repressor Rex [Oscillospiraceae bacterium]
MKKNNAKVSVAVIRRLPRYYRHLSELMQQGTVRISSSALGRSMGLTASQIRQDLFCFGGFGQQGYGYNVEKLRDEIGDILGINRGHTAVVLGVGNLGHALIQNFKFGNNGFNLEAAFDIDDDVIGTNVGNIPVYGIDELDEYLRLHRVDIGVLTVPRSVANTMAEQLVRGGVKGIWNFTNLELKLEGAQDVVVENVHFADSLLTLSYMISGRDHNGEEEE